jgi:DNA polymerase I
LSLSEQPQQNQIIYLIDASIYIFQAHFSPNIECVDDEGNELSAVYGFIQFLLQFLRRIKPERIGIAMDESLFCGFRHDLCSNYKSNRELPDENLAMQLNACAEVCQIIGLSAYSSKKYEADDIIGTLSSRMYQHSDDEIAVCIVSRDKDLAQLLKTSKDYLWDYSSNRKRYRTDIQQEYGVTPEQFPDYLGLVGDAVDCITGVPGVGPVKARELLKNFESLEGVYQNLDLISQLPLRGAGRLASVLEEHHELAKLSKSLATIVCDAVEEHEDFANAVPDSLRQSGIDLQSFEQFLFEYRFSQNDRAYLLSVANQFSRV